MAPLNYRDMQVASQPIVQASYGVTRVYKLQIKELNELQELMFAKKLELDALKDEVFEWKTQVQQVSLQNSILERRRDSRLQKLQLLNDGLVGIQNEYANKRQVAKKGQALYAQQCRMDHVSEKTRYVRARQMEYDKLLREKELGFRRTRDQLLEDVESYRTLNLTNEQTLQESFRKIEDSCNAKRYEWLEEYQCAWKARLESKKRLKRQIKQLNMGSLVVIRDKSRAEYEKLQKTSHALIENCKQMKKSKTEYQAKICDCEIQIENQRNIFNRTSQEMAYHQESIKSMHQTLQQLETQRRQLHNELQNMRGKIRVYCRIRPQSGTNATIGAFDYSRGRQSITIHDRDSTHTFEFDRVFGTSSTNKEVFQEIEPLIQSSIDGYNVCVFAYGQTGSGKTYTMQNERDGMVPMTLQYMVPYCYNYLKEYGWKIDLFCTFVEIYNDKIVDLFQEGGTSCNKLHEIKHDDNTQTTYITNVCRIHIESPAQIQQMVTKAMATRATASTRHNSKSSRSHSVFTIEIQTEKSTSKLHFVDLAGSERVDPTNKTRLAETCHINKSLSSLKDVIRALRTTSATSSSSSSSHVPFRNSKLTHLLKYSLLANSKTLMFATVAHTSAATARETLSTLRFAAEVNGTVARARSAVVRRRGT